jgi:hypothetical protein
MKKRRPRNPSAAPQETSVRYSKDRRIVLLDQQPLREEAGGEAKRIMREVSEHAEKIAEFDRTIQPAFERWETEHLGPILDEERRLNIKISELERLVEFADFEALFTGRDPYEIFEEVSREFADDSPKPDSSASDEEEPEAVPPPEPDPDEGYDADERDFRSYVRFVFGDDPDSLGKGKYRRLFEEYLRWRKKHASTFSSGSKDTTDIPARVKELYRVLVRRLHPDTGRERSNPHIQKLWHDLQDAYAALDVERLEILLAITDLHESGSAVRSSLFHLRQVSRQLRNQLDALKLRIHQAKKSPAWTFWYAKDRKAAGEKLRAAAQKRVLKSKEELTRLEREVERWKEESLRKKAPRRAAFGNPPAKPGSSSKKKKRDSDTQDLFEF